MCIKTPYLSTSQLNPLYCDLPALPPKMTYSRPKNLNIITNQLPFSEGGSTDFLNFTFKDLKDQFTYNKIFNEKN